MEDCEANRVFPVSVQDPGNCIAFSYLYSPTFGSRTVRLFLKAARPASRYSSR